MANSILSVAQTATQNTPQYQLDPQALQVLLSQSDSAQTDTEIERQRTAFISNFGCEFGQNIQPKHLK